MVEVCVHDGKLVNEQSDLLNSVEAGDLLPVIDSCVNELRVRESWTFMSDVFDIDLNGKTIPRLTEPFANSGRGTPWSRRIMTAFPKSAYRSLIKLFKPPDCRSPSR